jgi:phosphoribosylglycinamide formyltransferase-1
VHFVTEALDHGPIVIQSAVPVHPDDTEDTLAARVLATEHQIYPRAVRWFVDGALEVAGGRVRQRDGQAQWLIAPDTPRLAP